ALELVQKITNSSSNGRMEEELVQKWTNSAPSPARPLELVQKVNELELRRPDGREVSAKS
ncbi:hypothetical protein, partial [Paenibacillus koleovorans]|uniref:hypothetical protein n=1 Tax=Paenibacillus koleovorans TaxID=121608 RepID=UPI001C3F6BC9